jgi:hypothetical protein
MGSVPNIYSLLLPSIPIGGTFLSDKLFLYGSWGEMRGAKIAVNINNT